MLRDVCCLGTNLTMTTLDNNVPVGTRRCRCHSETLLCHLTLMARSCAFRLDPCSLRRSLSPTPAPSWSLHVLSSPPSCRFVLRNKVFSWWSRSLQLEQLWFAEGIPPDTRLLLLHRDCRRSRGTQTAAAAVVVTQQLEEWAALNEGAKLASLPGSCTAAEFIVPAEIPAAGISAANGSVVRGSVLLTVVWCVDQCC